MNNKWKFSFFSLLTINVVVILSFAALIGVFSPKKEQRNLPQMETNKEVHFKVVSSKNEINKLLEEYLKKKKQEKQIKYEVLLNDDIVLIGSIIAFGKKVSLKMNFEPKVVANGDLVLIGKTIKLGRLHLPDKTVLEYIRNHYDLPNWVIVHPVKREIYVSLNSLKMKSKIKVKANTFNLQEDNITFNVTLLP
jgi:uncharacterized protein YpmS